MTAAVRRQLGHLMKLLLINYPQLLTPGGHSGAVRYASADNPSVQAACRVTADCISLRADAPGSTHTTALRIDSHQELVTQMQQAVGPATALTTVHPHPRLARMSCFWMGQRRWTRPRRHYKAELRKQKHRKGVDIGNQRQHKWGMLSLPAAARLGQVAWKRIRRVVGLNPWGEQLLLRIKHHAISIYNPITGGLECPHQECTRAGRTDLHHVFWECPAARHLRDILVTRWRAAGVGQVDFEEAIFALTLPTQPTGIMRATDKVIANLLDENAEPMGELVDRMVSSCWSLGAALYLLAVWRWRVAHFDAQNDVSREYHAAGFKARLRYGHLGITRDQVHNVPPQLQVQLSTTICKMLGGDWDGQDWAIHRPGFCYLIAFAGGTTSQPHADAGSGTLVVKVHYQTGRHEIQYLSSNNYSGEQLGPQHVAQLGLLRGLRRCYTQHWSPVHVMGDQEDIIKRQDTRKPPRAGHLKDGFWKTRRAADAAAVEDYTLQPRELNRTAQELGRLALTMGLSVEWFARELPAAGARWAGILSFARHDVKQGLIVHQNTTPPGGVAATV